MWCSVAVPLVLAAIGLASWLDRTRVERRWLAAALACWGLSFAVAYLGIYRAAAANPYLRWFWSERFLNPWVPGALGRGFDAVREFLFTSFVAGVVEVGLTPLSELAVLGVVVVVLGFACLGIWRVWSTRPHALLLLGGAPGAAVLASAMGAYPIAPRLVLFCVPLLMIVIAAGLVVVLTSPLRIPKIVASGLLLVVIAAGQLRNVVLVDDPYREEHLRPAVEFWRKATRPGEAVYVTAGALPGWAFYTTDWQAPDTAGWPGWRGREARVDRHSRTRRRGNGRSMATAPSWPLLSEAASSFLASRMGRRCTSAAGGDLPPIRDGRVPRPSASRRCPADRVGDRNALVRPRDTAR